jgi:hypothetical protein
MTANKIVDLRDKFRDAFTGWLETEKTLRSRVRTAITAAAMAQKEVMSELKKPSASYRRY